MLGGAVAIAATLAIAPVASASSSKAKSCVTGGGTKLTGAAVCKALAYFQGKPMTFISAGSIGGVYDLDARDLSPYLSTYLRSSVNPVDYQSGETIPGQDTLAASIPNGLTIGEANPVGDILNAATNTPGINFNLAREAFIGAIPQGAQVLITNPSLTPITTFKQLVTTPGLSLIGTCAGQPDLFEHMLDAIWGAHISYTCGFSNANAVTQGFIEHDAALDVNALANQGPLLKGGVGRGIAESQAAVKGLAFQNTLTGAVTPAQAAQEVPPKTKAEKKELAVAEATIKAANIILIMPTKTPGPDQQVMRDAVAWAMKQPALQNQMLNAGVTDRLISGPSAKKTYLDIQKNVAILTTIMNSKP